MKTLIIGVAGTGKSYLVREMKRRGLNAVDVDKGLATFVDGDGSEVPYDPVHGEGWWKSHYYVLKPGKLERLLEENESIYVFGDVGGRPGMSDGLLDVTHLFGRVCYLRAPLRLIRKRLSDRADNPFGKNPEEVEGMAAHKARMDGVAKRMKFEIVDATMPTEAIIRALMGSSKR